MAPLSSEKRIKMTSKINFKRNLYSDHNNCAPKLSVRRMYSKKWKTYLFPSIAKQSTKSYPLLPRPWFLHHCRNAHGSLYALPRTHVRLLRSSDVRLAPKNYAFIEYEDEFKAGNALSSLNETQVGSATLKLSYAKKWSICMVRWSWGVG